MSDTKRLTVALDGKTVLDVEVLDAHLNINRNLEQVRSNPALAAAMAGAPADVVAELPGEQVAWQTYGSTIEVTYRLRFTGADAGITEFRDA